MGICTSDPRSLNDDITQQSNNQNKPEPVNQNLPEDNNQLNNNEEEKEKAKAALKIQQGFRGNKAKQEANQKREELNLDKPKDWEEYKNIFNEPNFPSSIQDKLKKFTITKDDRVFPPQIDKDGNIYKGQWSKGYHNGYGKLLKTDGTFIEAMWIQGKFVEANILFSSGDVYVGSFYTGTRYNKDGAQQNNYTLQSGQKNIGTINYEDGSVYVGDVQNDLRHGRGTTQNKDGAQYEGEYFNGQQNGQGTFKWPDGTKYVGQWNNGIMHGKGIYTEKDGTIYEGEFIDGKRQGKGILIFQDKSRYEGEFLNNKKHGKGKIITKDGLVKDCEYNNDQAIKAF